jgi:glycosyltransferase involved in cell wall biosynthesis
MLKVLLVSRDFKHPNRGGVVNYIEILHNNLKNNGYDIDHFVQGFRNNFKFNFILPIVYFFKLFELKKILKENKPDIIHLNPSLVWGSMIRDFIFLKTIKKRNIPVLFFIHGWQNSIAKKFNSSIFRKYFKKRFAMTDAIIVLAEEFKNELINLGVNSEKISVSSTMVESIKYYPSDKEFNNPFTVLFCANMKKEKGPFTVLNTVPKVLTEFPETKFLFIGSGKDLEELKEKTIERGLEKNVEFTGYVSEEEKQSYFKKSHIFVFPTEHGEGFPTVILEAMASGMLLITTAVAGLKDALKDGKQGLIINSNPPELEEVSQKIIQLLKNEEYMKQISKNNINEVKEKYDVKVVTKEIEKIYETIM